MAAAFPISLAAQDKDKDQERDKRSSSAEQTVSLKGAIACEKSDPSYAIEVPDRAGHALTLEHRKCIWTEPMVIAGVKTKDGVEVNFAEVMEGLLHVHGFDVNTMESGDHITWQTMGQVQGEKGPATTKGRWSFMRGTGKFKGIKGGGTYLGKLEADDRLTLNLEGVYVPAAMVGEKK